MRVALIANRSSGSGTDVDAVGAALRAHGAAVTVFDIDDTEAVRASWRDGVAEPEPARLVVAGGDGSIAPVAALASSLGVPLAVVATGTANDFARDLDLPTDLDTACALAANPSAPRQQLQLARANGHPFVNAASCGLSVVAAHRATPLKPKLGPLAYAAGALRAGLTGTPIRARVQTGDGRPAHDGRAWQVIVAATGAFGGGSGIEQADARDHLLDVVVVTAGSRLALVRRAFGLRTGRVARQPGVVHARGATIRVEVADATEWNVDGEVEALGAATFTTGGEEYEVVVP